MTEMLRICALLDKAEMEADYVQVLEGLARKGHRLITLLHTPTRTWKPTLSNLEIGITKEPLLLDRILIFNVLLLKAVKVIKKENIDVIYATGNRLGEGLLAGLLTHKPVLCDVRNPWSTQWDELSSQVTFRSKMGRFFRKIRFFSEERLIKKAQKIVAFSPGIKSWLVSYLGVREDLIEVIPPHVNTKIFHPLLDGNIVRDKYGLRDSPLIMYVGAINPSRGIDVLISALAKMKNEFINAIVMIVGPQLKSNSPYLKKLDSLVHSLNLEKQVIFTGFVPFKEVPCYMSAADILVIPHRYTYTYEISPPVKILEYMVCQKPIVTTDVGISDFLLDGENGLTVKPDSAEELTAGLVRLFKEPSLAQRLASDGRMLVENKFMVEKMVDKFEQILVALTTGRREVR